VKERLVICNDEDTDGRISYTSRLTGDLLLTYLHES